MADLADERFWCLIVTVLCAFVGVALSALFALFRVPRGQRRAFLNRVQTEVGVALFASLWSSLLLGGCVFVPLAALSLLFPLPRRIILWLFLPIWAVAYSVIASMWIRRVFRDALSSPDDRPWLADDEMPPERK